MNDVSSFLRLSTKEIKLQKARDLFFEWYEGGGAKGHISGPPLPYWTGDSKTLMFTSSENAAVGLFAEFLRKKGYKVEEG